jgi:hypothetical protein
MFASSVTKSVHVCVISRRVGFEERLRAAQERLFCERRESNFVLLGSDAE